MPWQTMAALVCIKVKADTHQSYDYMYGMTIVVIIKMGCGHSQIDNALMSMFVNNALLGGGVRVRIWIREQKKIKRRSKVLLSL